MTIRQYREKHGLSLDAFGKLVEKSRSYVFEIESTGRAPARLALAIEQATNGEIDAATLNHEVALARRAVA